MKQMKKPIQCHLWKKKNITLKDLDFNQVKKFEDSSHFARSVLSCKQCGQLYFYEFLEFVDFDGGDDKMYAVHIPIDPQDIEKLQAKSSFELLRYIPRLLWDYDSKIYWIGRNN